MDVGAIVQNPICASVAQGGGRGVRLEGDDSGTGRLSRPDSCGSVFENNTLGCGETEQRSAFQIGLGMRLAVRYVGGGDHAGGQRQSCGLDADLGQATGAGSDDGPAIRRKAGEQSDRSGQGDHTFEVNNTGGTDQLTISLGTQQNPSSQDQITLNLNANSNEQIVLNLLNGQASTPTPSSSGLSVVA